MSSQSGGVDGKRKMYYHELALTIDELEQITLDVASSKLDKEQLTRLLEAACKRSE